MEKALKFKKLGNEQYKNRNYRQAINYYTKAIACQEDHVFYSNRSSCYLALHEYKKAIQDGLKAISLKPDFVKAYYKTGKAYKRTGQLENAIDYFKQGLDIEADPTIRKELEDSKILNIY